MQWDFGRSYEYLHENAISQSRRRASGVIRHFDESLCGGSQPLLSRIEGLDGHYSRYTLNAPFGRGDVQIVQFDADLALCVVHGTMLSGWDSDYFGRSWLRFGFMQAGAMLIDVDGEHSLDVQPMSAHLVSLPNGRRCTVKLSKSDLSIVAIFIRKTTLEKLIGFPLGKIPSHVAHAFAEADKLGKVLNVPLRGSLFQLCQNVLTSSQPPFLRPIYLWGKALELITEFLLFLESAAPGAGPKLALSIQDKRNLAKAQAIIDEDMMTTLTLPELAKSVGMSRCRLSNGFREVYGVTVQSYSIELKMRYAENFIMNREGSLAELAARLGYSHANCLSAAVKRYFGMSPRQLAKQGYSAQRFESRTPSEMNPVVSTASR